MRNASKCFLCFRPPATLEIDDGVDCSADRMLSLIAAARNSNRLNKKVKKKKSLPKTKTPDPNSVADHREPPPRTSRRSFSTVVKAVMFETSLSRRVRDARSRSRSRSDQSVRSPPPADQEPKSTADQTAAITLDLKTDSNQTLEENNTSLASDCSFASVTENTKRSEIGGGTKERIINPVVCLVLLSLCATVFWGRVCAVMTTTVWIYAWQSGAVVVGLGEMLKLRRKKKMNMEGRETEKVTTVYLQKETNSID